MTFLEYFFLEVNFPHFESVLALKYDILGLDGMKYDFFDISLDLADSE